MSELVFPHSIDAGTAITANEVQSNFEAISTVVNGQLQGGSGSDGNLAADGVTARELADLLLKAGLPPYGAREGLASQPSSSTPGLFVSPGSGLALDYTAGTVWIRDDSGVVAAEALIPAVITAGSVSVGANSSGNPRLDQVIATLTGYGTATVSVLAGTPNAATTINTRTGAATIPSDAIRIADVLVTNGFAGPFVTHTSLRNRLVWAVPMQFDYSAVSTLDIVLGRLEEERVTLDYDFETSAFSSIFYSKGGSASAIYSYVLNETAMDTADTKTPADLGDAGGTSGVMARVPSVAGAGGVAYTGRHTFHMNPMTDTLGGGVGYHGEGVYTARSITGSNNHRLSTARIGTLESGLNITTSDVSWMTIQPVSGTLTGTLIVDRVPTQFPTA